MNATSFRLEFQAKSLFCIGTSSLFRHSRFDLRHPFWPGCGRPLSFVGNRVAKNRDVPLFPARRIFLYGKPGDEVKERHVQNM
jgi:hypothetical protein